MVHQPIGHLDPEFLAIMDEVREGLRRLFRTRNGLTFPISGTGSAGMEACLANLIEDGDKVLVFVKGYFGNRMAQMAERLGAEVVVVEQEWGKPLTLTMRAMLYESITLRLWQSFTLKHQRAFFNPLKKSQDVLANTMP